MEKMKALRKKLAAKGGFTLVELIVVIAILAILAAVAVPTYTGYIAKAKEAADLQVLSSINTAAQGLVAGDGGTVTTIKVSASGGVISKIEVSANPNTADPTEAELKLLITGSSTGTYPKLTSNGTYASGATWSSEAWTAGVSA